MGTARLFACMAAGLVLFGCRAAEPPDDAQSRPQQAGQPMDPVRTAARFAGIRASALTGDQEGVQRNMHALSEDLRRAMKIPDGARRIDPERARRAALAIHGVRSASWVDGSNLLVRVDGAALRSQRTIDDVCVALEPLGDTLAVVVHVQNAAATTGEEMDTLSRNCQLREGDYAFMQRERRMDVLDPDIRAQHRANADRARQAQSSRQSDGDRAALEAIPEM